MLALCHAALVSLLLAADPGYDTVLLQNGGRLVGTVVEESPTGGVTIQIPGGQLRTVKPDEVFRVEYRDGTFGVVGAKPPPAPAEPPPAAAPPEAPAAGPPPAPAPAPAPAAPPDAPPAPATPPPPPEGPAPVGQVYPAVPVGAPHPPPGPPYRVGRPGVMRPGPFMFAMGLGVAAPGGTAEAGRPMSELFRPQLLIQMEGGLRFTPWVMGSLILDLGVGDAAGTIGDACRFAGGSDCSALTARFGLQLRYAFTPLAATTTWVSVGTAAEMGMISFDATSTTNDLVYTGWEVLRLGAGIDFRLTPGFGWGLFLNAGFGRYSEVEDASGTYTLPTTEGHSWVQAGARFILSP